MNCVVYDAIGGERRYKIIVVIEPVNQSNPVDQ